MVLPFKKKYRKVCSRSLGIAEPVGAKRQVRRWHRADWWTTEERIDQSCVSLAEHSSAVGHRQILLNIRVPSHKLVCGAWREISMHSALDSIHTGCWVKELMAIVTEPCHTRISHEHLRLMYGIVITMYWKPHTVGPFLGHQSDDRYTKCTEHLYTIPSGNAAVLYRSGVSNICGVNTSNNFKQQT